MHSKGYSMHSQAMSSVRKLLSPSDKPIKYLEACFVADLGSGRPPGGHWTMQSFSNFDNNGRSEIDRYLLIPLGLARGIIYLLSRLKWGPRRFDSPDLMQIRFQRNRNPRYRFSEHIFAAGFLRFRSFFIDAFSGSGLIRYWFRYCKDTD